MSWTIREECAGEAEAIRALTERAFDGHPYSDGDEANVIDRLRADGDLLLSLVAVGGKTVLGHAAWSAARLSDGSTGWLVLGPIAVEPAQHGKGIGRALIETGEAHWRARGAKGITVLGDPAFYSRFGFAQHTPLTLPGELGEFLQVRSFGTPIPAATISYVRAFGQSLLE